MKRLGLLLVVLAVLLPVLALAAAGTATIGETRRIGSVRKVLWTWTSGTGAEGGTVTSTTTAAFDGKVICLITDPGSTAPTDNYDITITDVDGIDVLLGAGANRDTANNEYVADASLGAVASSKLTLNITNAGDAKEGVVVLYLR